MEKAEKHSKTQLCRLLKYSLPNWMSYELANKAARDIIQRNFISKGISTFGQLREYLETRSKTADDRETLYNSKWQRLKVLAAVYAEYSRLRDVVKKRQSQSIFTQKKFDKEHEAEIEAFPETEERLSGGRKKFKMNFIVNSSVFRYN